MFNTQCNGVISIEPPQPINKFVYLCDKKFHVEGITDLFNTEKTYGLVVVRGHNTEFYKICGTQTTQLGKKQVRIAKNHRKGGQSAPRFGRIRDEEVKKYVTSLSDRCKEYYVGYDNLSQVDFFVLVGTGDKKDMLYEKLHPDLKKIGTVRSIPSNFEVHQIREVTDKMLVDFVLDLERNIVGEFFSNIDKQTNLAVYGDKEIVKRIKSGNLEKIIIHRDLLTNKKINLNKIKEKCDKISCEVIEIVGGFEKAEEILRGFGGIVGISRY
jgi:peptide chain release factor subunit 1